MISLRRLAGSSVLRGTDVAVQVAAALWITPQLIHALGRERYGVWVVVLMLVSYIDIFDLGLTSAVTRHVSRALGRQNLDEARETVRSAFSLLSFIGAGCLLLVAGLAAAAPHFIHDAAQAAPVRALILILGCTIALSFPARVFTGVLEAFVRYECTTFTSIVRTVLTNVVLAAVLRNGADLVQVVAVVACGGLLHRMLNYIFARRVLPGMKLFPLRTAPDARAALLSYGAKNFQMKLIELVRFRIDNLVIAGFLGAAQVPAYSVGMSLIRYFREAIESFGGVLMPVFSHADGAGNRDRLRAQFSAATKASAVLSTFGAGTLALYGDLFIARWLGPGFHESYLVALILAGPFLLAMAQNPGIYLLYGMSKQDRLLRLNIAEAVLNLVLSLWLVTKFGIFGVALGTAISLLITKVAVQPWILCQEAGLRLRTYYLEMLLLPIVVTAAPMFACYAALARWLRPEYPMLLLAVVAQTLAVAPMVYWLLVSRIGSADRALLFPHKIA